MGQTESVSGGVAPNLRDLRVYQEAQLYAAAIAKAVARFPREERFALADQMGRAASSVYANIAEGHARRSKREQWRFYDMARSSLTECRAHIDQAALRALLDAASVAALQKQAVHVSRLLAGLMRSIDPEASSRLDAGGGGR
jgi:four helix bundle protein